MASNMNGSMTLLDKLNRAICDTSCEIEKRKTTSRERKNVA